MIFTASEPVFGIPQADYMDIGSRDNSLESPRMETQPNGYFPAAKWAALILMENGRRAQELLL